MSRQSLSALFLYMPFFGMLFGLFAAVVISIPALAPHTTPILLLAASVALTAIALMLTAPPRLTPTAQLAA